jgi:hypothetical protein
MEIVWSDCAFWVDWMEGPKNSEGFKPRPLHMCKRNTQFFCVCTTPWEQQIEVNKSDLILPCKVLAQGVYLPSGNSMLLRHMILSLLQTMLDHVYSIDSWTEPYYGWRDRICNCMLYSSFCVHLMLHLFQADHVHRACIGNLLFFILYRSVFSHTSVILYTQECFCLPLVS